MSKPIFIFLLSIALLLPARPGSGGERVCGCPVLRVVDGDTLVVRFQGKKERVRLLNVDTPESVHPDKKRNTPLGKAASAYTRSKLSGKSVCLEFEGRKRGRYGRLLAYVILVPDKNGKTARENFNLELVRLGWSPYYVKYGPSKTYHDRFLAAQAKARSRGLRIWAGSAPMAEVSSHSRTNGNLKKENTPVRKRKG